MLINNEFIKNIINDLNIKITGVLHIGAHECEELPFYNNYLNLSNNDIIWLEAINELVIKNQNKNIPNVYHAVITDKDNDIVNFNISNNYQSSSVLKFGTHSKRHPNIIYVNNILQKTITIDTFFYKNNINPEKYVFWNIDIQGAEIMALNGSINSLKYVKIIYIEVTTEELYENCALINIIDDFLKKHHFTRVITEMTEYGWGDAIYISNLIKNKNK